MEKFNFYTLDLWLGSLTDALNSTGKVAFAVAHNYRVIKEALTEYTTKKDEIIRKYGEENEGVFTITDEEKLEEANKELSEFAEMKVAVDILKIHEAAFEDAGLTALQMLNLEWMIETTPKKTTKEARSDKDRFGFDI